MQYDVILTPFFKRCVKKLQKRFPSVKNDIRLAIEVLLENPKVGAAIPGGLGVRKLRVKNSDMKKGKSGSYRLIYYNNEPSLEIIYLLLLYAKSDQENLSNKDLKDLLDFINETSGS